MNTAKYHQHDIHDIHQQRDVAATGSPLGPVLAEIAMVELKNSIVTNLNNHLCLSKRYINTCDTLTIVNEESIMYFKN